MSTNVPSSQAEAMIRRVSPEGRALAERERKRKQRANARIVARMALAGVAVAGVTTVVDLAIVPIGLVGILFAVLFFVAACIIIAVLAREKPMPLEKARLDTLPVETERWLEQQHGQLPRTSSALLDSITLRLGDMAPQLATLDPAEPAADAVRRLLATDLPALIRGYQQVPASLRASSGNGGSSADAHLLHGLGVIDGEIGRMTEQLARGAFDELATQHRFLEIKYEGAGDLG